MSGFFDLNIPRDVKHLSELQEEISQYVGQLILNVLYGVAKNIGAEYTVGERVYGTLAKAKVPKRLKQLLVKLQGIMGRKAPSPYEPFEIGGMKLYRKDRPLTHGEWREFEDKIMDYLRPYFSSLAEETAVKLMLSGLATAEAERQQKRGHENRSYAQMERDQFQGYIPDNLKSCEERFNISRDQKNMMIMAEARVGEHLQKVSDNIRNSIKQQFLAAYRQGKNPRQIASDLYWIREDRPELKSYSAETILRDWLRVAVTETAMIHAVGRMSGYEEQARQSVNNPELAIYYIFHGSGRCDWCNPRQGTIVRHIPLETVGDESNDSLSSKGIDDPYTDIAGWIGKNNVGFPKAQWRICTPSHPHCMCRFTRFYPDSQEWDAENQRIRLKGDKDFEKYLPPKMLKEIEDSEARLRARKDKREADRKIGIHKKDMDYMENEIKNSRRRVIAMSPSGRRVVEMPNGNRYMEIPNSEIAEATDRWRKTRAAERGPIPISPNSKDFDLYFGGL